MNNAEIIARVKVALSDNSTYSTRELLTKIGEPALPLTKLAATILAPFARRGPAETRVLYGKPRTVRPWLWHDYGSSHDEVQSHCPACGRKL